MNQRSSAFVRSHRFSANLGPRLLSLALLLFTLLPSTPAAAQPSIATLAIANLGTGQATFNFTASASGTGYFTLLEGSAVTPGNGSQICAGHDGNGQTATRFGSLVLTANAPGSYTVRGLRAATDYTVCFTADDGAALQETPVSTTFTTPALTPSMAAVWFSGNDAGFTPSSAWFTSLSLAPDGAPCVAFRDGKYASKATVFRRNGGTWNPVGAAGFSAGEVGSLTSAIAPDGSIYVAYYDTTLGNRATVQRFNGSNWTTVGPAGFSATTASWPRLAFGPDGAPYVAFQDYAAGRRVTVMRFDGTTWNVVDHAGLSSGQANNIGLVIAPDGAPLVFYVEAAISGLAYVQRFDGATWTILGNTSCYPSVVGGPSFALDLEGRPSVVFSDYANGSKATMVRFDGGTWHVVGRAAFSAKAVLSPTLAYSPDGNPWVAYSDVEVPYVATVMRFPAGSTTDWEVVGLPGFSGGSINYLNLAFGLDGVPLVAYMDSARATKATLARLTPTAAVSSVDAPADGLLHAGEQLAFTVAFAEPVTTTGIPRLPITIGSTTRYAAFTAALSDATHLKFVYLVQYGDIDRDGITIFSALDLNGGSITTQSTGAPALLQLPGSAHLPSVCVDTAPILAPPAFIQVGANQVNLLLQANTSGTGYFTILAGTTQPGDGAQTKAGLAADGQRAARFGSLKLAANTAGTYLVRDLPASTTYTVAFTADDGTLLQTQPATASFKTTDFTIGDKMAWGEVGDTQLGTSPAYVCDLLFSSAGVPTLVGWGVDGAARTKVWTYASETGTWADAPTAGFGTRTTGIPSAAFGPDGRLYLAFRDGDYTRHLSVYRLNEGTWTPVGRPGFSLNEVGWLSLAFSPSGLPWVASDLFQTPQIWQFDGTNWMQGASSMYARIPNTPTLAFGPNGVPYIACREDTDETATVVSFGGKSWNPVGPIALSATGIGTVSFAIASDGVLYLAFDDPTCAGKATVLTYDGAAWKPVGAAGFSREAIQSPNLRIGPDGYPYLAFANKIYPNTLVLMRFDGANWRTVARGGASSALSAGRLRMAFSPAGQPYVAFSNSSYTRPVVVTLRAPSYSDWASANFSLYELEVPRVSGARADPDNAGLPNLLRYAFDLPPRGAVTNPVQGRTISSGGEQFFALEFPCRTQAAPGLVYEVQASSDLVTWETVSAWSADVAGTIVAPDNVPIGSTPRRFLRLSITVP